LSALFYKKIKEIMACDLTKGRALPCRESVGGLKAVYFVDFGDLGTVTLTADEVTNMTGVSGALTAYRYELKGTSSVEQTINASRENGTVFYDQSVTLSLPQLSKEDNNEIKLIAYGRPHIFVEDYNGNVLLVGREYGADVTGGTIASGAAMGDMSGYTLTFNAMERTPANFVEVDITEAKFPFSEMAGLTGTVTIEVS
jgi:hypothetical protein